jgi:hypothetical protein
MIKNIGPIDKRMRLIFAAVVAILFFTKLISGTVAIVLGILAIVFALTAFIGFCPLYYPFNIKSS